MSKYFKNNKSEGDGEWWSVEKSRTKPRSYSCKPDIGPSGDHKSLETPQLKPNSRINMWLNNIGSGSSQNSCSNELYRLNEDYLERINFIRRKLEMTELADSQERRDQLVHNATPDFPVCPMNYECNLCKRNREEKESKMSPKNKQSLSSIGEKSKVSNATSHSSLIYNPPLKKICLRHTEPPAAASAPIDTNRTNHPKTDFINIPGLNLDNEEPGQCNKNKSIQCTSRDSELTEATSHLTDHSKPKCYHQRHMGDNIDLVEVDLYVEPEIVLKQPAKTAKNCIKFLPIKDDETTTSDNSNKKKFYDEIISNCSFSFNQLTAPPVPSHDSFFRSKKKLRKKRFNKRGKNKHSVDVQRTFSNTSETSDEIETNEIPAINAGSESETFDNALMTGLTVPSRTLRPMKLPLTAKLSELVHGVKCKKGRGDEVEGNIFEDDVTSAISGLKQRDTCVRVGKEYSNYRVAAEELAKRRTDDMKENACYHKRREKSENKFNNKKQQSVEYDFYSLGLPEGYTNEDVVHLNQETEEDSDSDCLRAIENCCCIRRIFKKRRPNFFSTR